MPLKHTQRDFGW